MPGSSDGRLPIGVALSGGTAKAVAHIGVLRALVDEGLPIDYLAGTSGGSLVAAFYASGMPLERIGEIARELSWAKLVKLRISRLGVVSSKPIEDFVKDHIGDAQFSDFDTPTAVVATDLATGKRHAFSSGGVARAVRASCTIPQIFLPVEIDKRYYVDGGFSEYLPVETLEDIGGMFVIGVHLAHKSPMYGRPRNYLQLAMHITGLVAKTNYVDSIKKADVVIHPDMDRFSPFDFEPSDDLMTAGYEATKKAIPKIEKEWKRKSGKIYQFLKKVSPHRQ
ncbi:MAG: patatin-like phospholipase family protein [Candidatus Latescibacterota bacterium]|nr:MAG: patatin-like phospholipase family protein [Candidatus Latescibacterota bacterium]